MSDKRDFLLAAVLMAFSVFEGIRLLLGHVEDLNDRGLTVVIVVGLFFWGILYATLSEEKWFQKWFGVAQILLAAGITMKQLFEMRNVAQHDLSWRWSVLIGSVVVFSKGLKDVYKATGM
jgi:hypothetical protein